MVATDYLVVVQTGDRKNAGTDANVKFIFHGEDRRQTEELMIEKCLKDKFERGMKDTFTLSANKHVGKIDSIELWMDSVGLGASWFVNTITVSYSKSGTCFTFPILRWLHPYRHYFISHLDTSLPQNDPYRDYRTMDQEEKRHLYQFYTTQPHLTPLLDELPEDEKISFEHQFDVMRKLASIKNDLEPDFCFAKGSKWKSLEELKDFCVTTLGEPYGTQQWDNDYFFAWQKMNGISPTLISLCTRIPTKLGITNEMVHTLLEGLTLEEAIEAKRLFIIDLDMFHNLPTKDGESVVPAPIALFFLEKHEQLLPIAIQLFQEKSEENPVFLPTDPHYTWTMAKMWYNVAESSYHHALTHLGFTHLFMEGICISMHRHFSQTHPLFKLLAPHLQYLLPINRVGMKMVLNAGGWFDTDFNIGLEGTIELLKRGKTTWRLNIHGILPNDLKLRGLDDPDILPGYHFRDDAQLLYDAIFDYVRGYTQIYYDCHDKIDCDWELQGFGDEIARRWEQGGCGVLGVPNDGVFSCVEDIVTVFTSIIFTCNVTHAAVTYPQYEEHSFLPNYPFILNGTPPKNKDPLTEADVVDSLPDRQTTVDIMAKTKLLSEQDMNCLGDFEVQYIYDPRAVQILERFRHDLLNISHLIKERNETRHPRYEWLDPENVHNAISI